MTHARTVLALAVLLAASFAQAAPPDAGKPRRLTPAEPPPAALTVPQEARGALHGSCTAATGACADYEGTFAGTDARAGCEKAKGTWSGSACPVEGTVATCTQRLQGSDDRIVTRSYAPTTADAARKACVSTPRGMFLKAK